MQLTENVYGYSWRGQGNNCNTYVLQYFVEGAARYALIDPGYRTVAAPVSNRRAMVGMRQEPALEILLSALEVDGINPYDIQLVINTHAHGDHCEASRWWKEQYGALVALHKAEQDQYAKTLRGSQRQSPAPAEDAQPDIFLEEGELRLGQPDAHSLQVIHTPGHSPGGISLYWPERKVLIVGDLIFYRSVGRYDLAGGSITKLRDGISRLAELDVEHLLTGHAYGHSGIISGKEEVVANFRYILNRVLP